MKTSSEDGLNINSFKKSLCDIFDRSPKHKKSIKSICVGESVEDVRTNVNRRVRAAIALNECPRTNKKSLALDSLDCNAPINEWLMDFERVVAPYVSDKVDPAKIT